MEVKPVNECIVISIDDDDDNDDDATADEKNNCFAAQVKTDR